MDPAPDRVRVPTFRRAESRDAAALAAFAERMFADAFGAQNRPEDMAVHAAARYHEALQLAEIRDPAWVTILGEDDGDLAAYAQLHPGTPPSCVTGPDPMELHRFYVDRRWHGTGVAARLMDLAKDAARERGARTLWLGVWERNPRAIAFYGKHGYRDVGTGTFVVGSDVQTDRIMVADLGAGGGTPG